MAKHDKDKVKRQRLQRLKGCAVAISAVALLCISERRMHTRLDKARRCEHLQTSTANGSEFMVQYTARGCVYLPADTPVCAADNVCFKDGLVEFYVAPFSADQWPWSFEDRVTANNQTSLEKAWRLFDGRCCRSRGGYATSRACLRAERLGLSCCRQHYQTRNEPRMLVDPAIFLGPNAVVLDTAVTNFQFGHSTSKIFQFASFALWASIFSPPGNSFCQSPSFSLGLFSQIQDGNIPNTIKEWIRIVAGLPATKRAAGSDHPRFTTTKHVIFDQKNPRCHLTDSCRPHSSPGSVCVQRAFFIHDYEQYFFRKADADQLNNAVDEALELPLCQQNVARRRGMMLLRTEGSGGRKLVNALDVEKLVNRVFRIQLANVTINSSMNAKQQAAKFREHDFIVSPHSSQLKNLAVACPCTIVVEINAMDGRRDPFSAGVQHRGIAYVQSANHTPENYGRPIDLGKVPGLQFRALRGLDVKVNMTKLEIDLDTAVKRHREMGCHVF